MEGPSIVIATEELARFKNKKPLQVLAASPQLVEKLQHKKFLKAISWGKHLILIFSGIKIRIHFLMFGSYRIDNPRMNRIPKLELHFAQGTIYFYSCAIKELTDDVWENYDWSIDLLSEQWKPQAAVKKLKASPERMVCDALLDQDIFAGLGNIMKNETLYRLRMHPETRVRDLTVSRLKSVVKESQIYAWLFYEWKKGNVLKRNWQIFRKKNCPVCGKKVTKKPTGKSERISHYCTHCQKKN